MRACAFRRGLGTAALLLLTAAPALAVPVHGQVLEVPAASTAVIATGSGPSQKTERYRTAGAPVAPGDTVDGNYDPKTGILTIDTPAHDTEVVSSASVALDSVVFILGVVILGGFLPWIGKRVFLDERF